MIHLPIAAAIPFGQVDPHVPNDLLMLLLLLGTLIFIWDLLDRRSASLRRTSGLSEKSEVVALKGSTNLPSKEYVSAKSGLASKPHGLIREAGCIIPVDVNPLNKKIKDRHIVQMLVHLRLIEEIEGQRPPYGILVMGLEARPVQVRNTVEKQRWLDSLLDEMRSIIEGVPALPAPSYYKCKSCDVREVCSHNAYLPSKAQNEAEDDEG